jgi:hypothetical protein
MKLIKSTTLNTFLWLLWRDIRALRKTFVSQWIDYSFIICAVVVLNNYFMTAFGMPVSFGVHMLVSQSIASMIWLITGDTNFLAMDVHGPKAISYELTLPITYRLIYLKYACAFVIKAVLVNLATFPLGAIFVLNKIDVSAIAPLKFLGITIFAAIVIALFSMMLAMLFKNIDALSKFWMRWGMIIWMFSGLYTPWYIMAKASIWAGYATLINPLVYCIEAAHAAFMGQQQFINFWLCILAIIAFGVLFAFVGMYFFKKRLDCV